MVKAKETTKFDYINTVLSWSHPSLSGLFFVCVMSTPANGLKSRWRGKFKKHSPTSMLHCEYPGSMVQRVCWIIVRPKYGAQRA